MDLKFVPNEPALLCGKVLVLADIHIGIEYELYKSGIKVPTQVAKMRVRIDNIIKKTKAEKIIFIGDIKHQVPGVSFQELREVPEFFSHFSKKMETHIVLGNHDSEIAALVDDVKIHDTPGFRMDDVYIAHGHAWPEEVFLKCKFLVLAHTHPLIEIKDKIGYRFKKSVWVKAELDPEKIKEKYKEYLKTKKGVIGIRNNIPAGSLPKVVLMPAFNELVGGATLNTETGRRKRETSETFLGPLTPFIKPEETEIFLLDGTFLGKLKDLK